ncbi:hypothetical protein Hypma_005971 [Hypsizygus marmoreus]|uniref:Uncharacterized protein n=1 Tax=Hypsizygus marmoreus TaxID=39966 RepID=A0A369K8D8_HYPMA|nr:hypothetical protein Hypma_005971 [Hypsizygus marmoreus]
MSPSASTSSPLTPAHISTIYLYLSHHSVPRIKIEQLMHVTFAEVEEPWLPSGSPFQRWYRIIATGLTISPPTERHRSRHGETPPDDTWRTIDFNMQMYAHGPSEWARLETGWGCGGLERIFSVGGDARAAPAAQHARPRRGETSRSSSLVRTPNTLYTARAMDYWVGSG